MQTLVKQECCINIFNSHPHSPIPPQGLAFISFKLGEVTPVFIIFKAKNGALAKLSFFLLH